MFCPFGERSRGNRNRGNRPERVSEVFRAFQSFSEVFRGFSEVFRGVLEGFRGFSESLSETLSECHFPLRVPGLVAPNRVAP